NSGLLNYLRWRWWRNFCLRNFDDFFKVRFINSHHFLFTYYTSLPLKGSNYQQQGYHQTQVKHQGAELLKIGLACFFGFMIQSHGFTVLIDRVYPESLKLHMTFVSLLPDN